MPSCSWRIAVPSLSIAIPRSRSRGRSVVSRRSPPRGQAAMAIAVKVQWARLMSSGISVLPASAWSIVWAREDAQVAARLSAARPVNPFAGYNPPARPQQDGQVTAAEQQAAADYRAGAGVATPGVPGEEEKSMAAEEGEEPPRDPEDRLPSLHRA
ncbi:hypothetical protein DYB36_014053 [Aphanomyces astaci]|uniref:Uncharacterized protein n=1 Tax=Aphanomyces astaci TaxID=112090 RepID=A0A396ZUR9_APHAT|nr:hypothetical protein DYB36_014053 [Aphanomyces astaci]